MESSIVISSLPSHTMSKLKSMYVEYHTFSRILKRLRRWNDVRTLGPNFLDYHRDRLKLVLYV